MIDLDLFLRFALALAIVLALIAGVAWVGRHYMSSGRIAGLGSRRRRLAIVEALPVDGRSRLVLFRRDDTEHLILLGPSGALAVETPIKGNFAKAIENEMRHD